MTIRQYWDLDFPDAGSELRYADPAQAADELEDHLRGAVRRRLASEVPVSCYLSGGLDSTVVLALACQERGTPLASLTVGLDRTGPLDERQKAAESAKYFGSPNTVVNVIDADICTAYPPPGRRQRRAGVRHFSCAAHVAIGRREPPGRQHRRLDRRRGRRGTGWLRLVQVLPFAAAFQSPWQSDRTACPLDDGLAIDRRRPASAAPVPQQPAASASLSKSPGTCSPNRANGSIRAAMWDRLDSHSAYEDLPISAERMPKWDPLNQSLYAAYKVMLPGLLLAAKGDRPLRAASTEGRYPFLDEKVIEFCSRIAPEYKLRGMTDKWLLRELAERVAPRQVSSQRKVMFRANMGRAFLKPDRPAWVDQLLSPESLAATGYFEPAVVDDVRTLLLGRQRRSARRFAFDMALAGVISTQLWHHLYCGGGLCELPVWSIEGYAGQRAGVSSVA